MPTPHKISFTPPPNPYIRFMCEQTALLSYNLCWKDWRKKVNYFWNLTNLFHIIKSKAIRINFWIGPESFSSLVLPDYKTFDTLRWQGRQLYAPAAFTPHGISLVFSSVRGWVDPGVIVWPQWFSQWKIPVTTPRIQRWTFRLAKQCLNQIGHRVPRLRNYSFPNFIIFGNAYCTVKEELRTPC